ncbi:MAG: DUF4421 domain-containing protein [Bacteroidales bacterium]|nr:DUF4421 domain-containing protein [Bacteroidales bacterium]
MFIYTDVWAVKDSTQIDTGYIEDLSDELALRVYGVNKYNNFAIIDKGSDSELLYAPNGRLNFGIAFNYKWLGLGVAINFPFINNDDDIYGKTERIDFQVNIFTRTLAIDGFLQYYKGFYVTNPDSYLNDWKEGMVYPQRPDIQTAALGASCLYIFNHKKYSAKAAFTHNELQKKSAGSFFLGGYFSLLAIVADSSMLPPELSGVFADESNLQNAGILSIGVAGGYSHTFVMWKKLYLSLTLIPGISVQKYRLDIVGNHEPQENIALSFKTLGRFAIVYNARKSFFGITSIVDNTSNGGDKKRPGSQLQYSVGSVRFFYGRRFNFFK